MSAGSQARMAEGETPIRPGLGPVQRVRAIVPRVKPNQCHPALHDPGVLPGREVGAAGTAREKRIGRAQLRLGEPGLDRLAGDAGHLGDVKRTQQNLEVIRVDVERQLLLVKGAVPGSKGSDLVVCPAVKAGA